MKIKKGLYFAKTHEWISQEKDNLCILGISDFAQSELGDIVYIALPDVGKTYKKGEKIGEVESVKSVSEIYAPADLKIAGVNLNLNESPEIINSDPYGSGYIAKIGLLGAADTLDLMDADSYEAFISTIHT